MCGICGIARLRGVRGHAIDAADLDAMQTAIAHRGPDDAGTSELGDGEVFLGHRRLSILDLSPLGHQPMSSSDGRYTVVFNGEIYNWRDLRADLLAAKRPLKSQSDTEVLLEGISEWGLDETLRRSAGMFAFALHDAHERRLHLVRDRMGKKPLAYVLAGDRLAFASELHALRRLTGIDLALDRDALADYFARKYVPGERTIHAAVKRVPPGAVMSVDLASGATSVRRYWSIEQVASRGVTQPTATLADIERLLDVAVRERMEADVPVGAFLSGGVDSTLVVALMQRHAKDPVKTFTIGFEESGYDESAKARAIAEALGTDHRERKVTPEEARSLMERLSAVFDEPFADESALPTYLVASLARSNVKVVLSGDGGDEVFGGYSSHARMARVAQLMAAPLGIRRAGAAPLSLVSARTWTRVGRMLRVGDGRLGERIHRLASLLRARDEREAASWMSTAWEQPPVVAGRAGLLPEAVLPDARARQRLRDQTSYLPGNILVKSDRATMAWGLEARAPLLDHRVVETAWRLPPEMLHEKRVLREIVARVGPREAVERRKHGFSVPVGAWIRGPLRGWAEDLLSEDRLRREGLLAVEPIQRAWRQHLSGERDWSSRLWTVLAFEVWLAAQPSGGAR